MPRTPAEEFVNSRNPGELSTLALLLDAENVLRLTSVLPGTRAGNPAAVREYLQAWRALKNHVLSAFHGASPHLVVRTDLGELLIADLDGSPSAHLTGVLDQEALGAPFSLWVQAVGEGPGIAVHLVAAVRRLTGQLPVRVPTHLAAPLVFAEESGSLDPARFLRLVYRELAAGHDQLDRVFDLFDLTNTDLAKLFSVSRQRVAQWREQGVPVAHQPKLNALARMGDLLERNLAPERIPGIVRTPAPAFGRRTLLEQIAQDHHESALRRVKDSFDWAKTA